MTKRSTSHQLLEPEITHSVTEHLTMAPVAQVLSSETNGNATVGALGRRKDGKPLKIRSYPKFDTLEEERQYRKQHLAAAYRVFAERGMAFPTILDM